MSRPYEERPPARPSQLRARPASAPANVERDPSPIGKRWIPWAGLAVAVLIGITVVALSGGLSSLDDRASAACTDRLVAVAGPTFKDFRVTEVISNPAKSYDIRGTYVGGTFACAVIGQTLEVPQAIIFPTGSPPQSW